MFGTQDPNEFDHLEAKNVQKKIAARKSMIAVKNEIFGDNEEEKELSGEDNDFSVESDDSDSDSSESDSDGEPKI